MARRPKLSNEDGRLPNGERTELDVRKLTDYCLSPNHPRGRHKARVFRDALRLEQGDAQELRMLLLRAARDDDAVRLVRDAWGERWQIDVAIARQNQRAVVRTIWIMRNGEEVPRFVTCWVL
jgi:hypothetical protein